MENLKKMNLDKFDLAILKVLQQNARASLNDIGAAVGLSSTPCWNRIKRMESAGVIRGYTVDIDPASLGFMDTVIVHVTLESHSEETLYEFGRALAQIPEVLEAFLVSGDYDYYIRIAVRDTRDYERLLRTTVPNTGDPAQQVLLCAAPVEGDDAAADGRGNGLVRANQAWALTIQVWPGFRIPNIRSFPARKFAMDFRRRLALAFVLSRCSVSCMPLSLVAGARIGRSLLVQVVSAEV